MFENIYDIKSASHTSVRGRQASGVHPSVNGIPTGVLSHSWFVNKMRVLLLSVCLTDRIFFLQRKPLAGDLRTSRRERDRRKCVFGLLLFLTYSRAWTRG